MDKIIIKKTVFNGENTNFFDVLGIISDVICDIIEFFDEKYGNVFDYESIVDNLCLDMHPKIIKSFFMEEK